MGDSALRRIATSATVRATSPIAIFSHAPCVCGACPGPGPTGGPNQSGRRGARAPVTRVTYNKERRHIIVQCTRIYLREGKGEGQPRLLVLVQDVHLGLDAHALAGGDADLHGAVRPRRAVEHGGDGRHERRGGVCTLVDLRVGGRHGVAVVVEAARDARHEEAVAPACAHGGQSGRAAKSGGDDDL